MTHVPTTTPVPSFFMLRANTDIDIFFDLDTFRSGPIPFAIRRLAQSRHQCADAGCYGRTYSSSTRGPHVRLFKFLFLQPI